MPVDWGDHAIQLYSLAGIPSFTLPSPFQCTARNRKLYPTIFNLISGEHSGWSYLIEWYSPRRTITKMLHFFDTLRCSFIRYQNPRTHHQAPITFHSYICILSSSYCIPSSFLSQSQTILSLHATHHHPLVALAKLKNPKLLCLKKYHKFTSRLNYS